jgi:hypothetical protein
VSSSSTLLSTDLWAKHQAHYLRAFLRALDLLKQKPLLPRDETGLNRELYGCLLRANRELDPEGLYPPPMIECCNQPDFSDEARSQREGKRPDFSWGFSDPHESNYLLSAKQFVIECKRLGTPDRSHWILNANYIRNGVLRFIDPAWGYAQRFPSAAMIGYLQSMEPDEILNEVNEVGSSHQLAAITLVENGWQRAAVSLLRNLLERSFSVSPIQLDHLWIDLRGIAVNPLNQSRKPPRRSRRGRLSKTHNTTKKRI